MDRILSIEFSSMAQHGEEGWKATAKRESGAETEMRLSDPEMALLQTQLGAIFAQ